MSSWGLSSIFVAAIIVHYIVYRYTYTAMTRTEREGVLTGGHHG